MSASPAWATPPSDLPNELASIEATAELLGRSLMPWQRRVAQVATERVTRPDGLTVWRYPTVVLTVPRQSGKTTLIGIIALQRALTRPGHRAYMTAQTGMDARERWKELADLANASQLSPFLDTRLATGSSRLTVTRTGGYIAPFAPTPKSLHGSVTDLVTIDEAFAFDDADGAELLGAVLPTQQTRPDSQLWIISTAGTSRSTWLRHWIDTGRAATTDQASTIAYFEWSCPGHLDVFSETSWPQFHPGIGYTADIDKLRAARDAAPPHVFRRAYGNQWTSQAAEAILDLTAWDELAAPGMTPPPPGTPIVLALDIDSSQRAAVIVAAWHDPAGGVLTRILNAASGTGWILDALRDAQTALGPIGIIAEDAGPTRSTLTQLTAAGIPITTPPARDVAAAVDTLTDLARRRLIRHDGHPTTRAALEVAATRPVADGGQRISRTDSAGPVSAAIATALAAHAAHLPAAQEPAIYA